MVCICTYVCVVFVCACYVSYYSIINMYVCMCVYTYVYIMCSMYMCACALGCASSTGYALV